MNTPGLRAGDWVEVRSAEEILASLDEQGCLEGLPFMPEMLQFCGKRLQVFKSAHKACNTLGGGGILRMKDAVHLNGIRCDGKAHGGCQAGCLLFWKQAWLKPAATDPTAAAQRLDTHRPIARGRSGCDVATLDRATRVTVATEAGAEGRYRCQATEHGRATTRARWWDPRPYVQDLASGNVRLRDFIGYGLIAALNIVRRHCRVEAHPSVRGRAGAQTPQETLNLRTGEWVQVRSKDEIMRTLDGKHRNRGLLFDVEMLPYCGQRYRVLTRVERLIDDRTGKMIAPRNACLILEGVTCGGYLSRDRMFCPRSIYPYWHEVWLERAEPQGQSRG